MTTAFFLKNGNPEPTNIDKVIDYKVEKEMIELGINISVIGEDKLLGWDYSYMNSDDNEMYQKGKEQEEYLIKFFNL